MARRGSVGSAVGTIVLVMFLVFFILLSIGLGVTTYLGFQQDEGKANENKKLATENKQLTSDMEWYRFQALLYRAYMGQAQNPKVFETLTTEREKFDGGRLTHKD